MKKIVQAIGKIIAEASTTSEKMDIINSLVTSIHGFSPMKNEPVGSVIWAKAEDVYANDYNPNSVAPPEMELLSHSIEKDGYTQPIVVWKTDEGYEVIDGFHRNRVGKEIETVKARIQGHLPVVVINKENESRGDRISSTVRHNRARGKHSIDGMADIILDLKRRNWSEKKISKELGMDADEVLRLSQITGLAEMFKDREFSKAWEADVSYETEQELINEQ